MVDPTDLGSGTTLRSKFLLFLFANPWLQAMHLRTYLSLPIGDFGRDGYNLSSIPMCPPGQSTWKDYDLQTTYC